MAAHQADTHDDRSFGGELDRVGDEVQQHLLDPRAVASRPRGDLRRQRQLKRKALRACLRTGAGARLLDRLTQVEVGEVELETAGLDPRQVEHVVDDRHHLLAGAGDLLGVGALLLVQCGVEQQLVHADHAVHRCADLVADVGQERRLDLRGLDRLITRDGQLGERPVALGDVLAEHDAAGTAVQHQIAAGHLDVDDRAVLEAVVARVVRQSAALVRTDRGDVAIHLLELLRR